VREELAAQITPVAIDKLMRTEQSRSNTRFIVEATIESIAAAGLLRTPVDADVIGKAVEWHKNAATDRNDVLLFEDDSEEELYDAVSKMLAEVDKKPRP